MIEQFEATIRTITFTSIILQATISVILGLKYFVQLYCWLFW